MNAIWIVMGNDVRQLLRHPESLFVVLVSPAILVALGLLAPVAGEAGRDDGAGTGERADLIVVAGPRFAGWVEPGDGLRVEADAAFPLEGPLAEGAAVARIEVRDDEVAVDIRPDVPAAWRAHDRVEDVLRRVRGQARDEALAASGVGASYAQLLDVETVTVEGTPASEPDPLGGRLPGVLVFVIVLAALTLVGDTLTAEKERKTMETLLATPHPRHRFVVAKGLVTLLAALTAGWTGLAVAVFLGMAGHTEALSATAGVGFALLVVGWSLQTVPLVIVLSAAAPDYRSMTLLSVPAVLFVTAPAGLSLFPDVELNPLTALVPIANLALLGRGLVAGVADPGATAVAVVASLGFVAGAVVVASRLLDREAAFLPRGSDPRGLEVARAFGLWAGVTATAAMFGSTAQALDLVLGAVFTQVVLFFGVTVGAVGFFGLPGRETLSLRRPSLRDGALAVVIALAMPLVAQLVVTMQEPLLPTHPLLVEQFSELAQFEGPWWVPVLVFAGLPAICEELLFRGLLLGLLRRAGVGTVARVGLVALAFGLTHLVWPRILPTAALGLVLGFVVVRSGSLWLAMGIHAVYNGLVIVAARGDGLPEVPAWATVLAASLVAAAIVGTNGRRTR